MMSKFTRSSVFSEAELATLLEEYRFKQEYLGRRYDFDVSIN